MKKIITIIALSFQFLFAQQNMMTISTAKNSGSEVDWETTITINVTDEIQTGFRLSMPAALRLIPLSVQIDQKNLWLQNATVVSGVDSVVSWSLLTDGVVFQFKTDQLRYGDQITKKTMTTIFRKDLTPESVIAIFPYAESRPTQQALESVTLPANLFVKE